MLSAARYLLTLIALVSVGPAILEQARALLEAGGPNWGRLAKGLAAVTPALVAIAVVGRTLLAFLPPGEPGSHGARSLPTTWAASHLLGTVALGLQLQLFGLIGVGGSPIAVFVPWLLAAAGRMATLPAAPRPRRVLATEPPHIAATALLICAVIAFLLPALLWSSPAEAESGSRSALDQLARNLAPQQLGRTLAPLSIASWPCLLLLVGHALATARRAPLGRRVLLLLPALLPFALAASQREASVTQLPLFFGAGCVFIVPWLRRADRRAACLAAIAFAACGLVSPSGLLLGLGGLLVLWLATPVASKLLISTAGAAALGAIALPGVLNGSLFEFGQRVVWDLASSLTRSPHRTGYWTLREMLGGGNDLQQWGLAWALIATVVVGFVGYRAIKRSAPLTGGARYVDPPGRELWTLIAIGALGLLVHVALAAWVVSTAEAPWIASDDSNSALFTLLPTALIVVGLVLVRPENPKRDRRRARTE